MCTYVMKKPSLQCKNCTDPNNCFLLVRRYRLHYQNPTLKEYINVFCEICWVPMHNTASYHESILKYAGMYPMTLCLWLSMAVLCIGIALLPIRNRLWLSILMPIEIRILPNFYIYVGKSKICLTFIQSNVSLHAFLSFSSASQVSSFSMFWTVTVYWNFLEKSIVWLHSWSGSGKMMPIWIPQHCS